MPGESMNCEPPYDVQQSAKTTIAGGQPSSPKSRSMFSGVLGRKALRFAHMSSCPVMPWIR